jgi:4'-phosphopantetheinyl transferase
MPLILYQREVSGTATLAVWRATETTAELERRAALSAADKETYLGVKLEKRRREWLAVRILLRLIAHQRHLAFLGNGKPVLFPSGHVSISHSGDLAGVVIAQHPVGLDIQGIDERISRIATKFCNEQEFRFLPEGTLRLEHLTIIWSAKESVFKYFGERVDFSDDIHVAPFHYRHTELKASYNGIHGRQEFVLTNVPFHGYHMVVAVAEQDAQGIATI